MEGVRAPDRGLTKIVEMGGNKVSLGLFKANPFNILQCPFPELCLADSKTDCTKSRVTYELTCKVCEGEEDGVSLGLARSAYRGNTGHTLHKRLLEHSADLRRGASSNGMAKHFLMAHPEVDRAQAGLFSAKVLGVRQLNMDRGILEALQIEELERETGTNILNSKSEWGRRTLRRITVAEV